MHFCSVKRTTNKVAMSKEKISYPSLHEASSDEADDCATEGQFPFGAQSPDLQKTSPTAPQEEFLSAEERDRRHRHATLCALCARDLSVAAPVAHFRVQLPCKHNVCTACAKKCVADPNAFACLHCTESEAALTVSRGVSDPAGNYYPSSHTERDACISELKRLLAAHYVNWDNYENMLDSQELGDEDIYEMFGESGAKKIAKQVATKVSGLLTTIKSVAWREREQTVWSALDEAAEERARTEEREPAPRGSLFVEEMQRRQRTLDDVFATMKFTLAHVYMAGARSVEDLRALGFDERKHLRRNMRCVAPILILVDRFGYSAPEHMRHLDNFELAACALHKCEVRALELTAAELVQRRATARDLRRFALKLDDWIAYADLGLPQALALGFDHRSMALTFPECTKPSPQTPARSLYVAVCVSRCEQPLNEADVAALSVREKKKRPKAKSSHKQRR